MSNIAKKPRKDECRVCAHPKRDTIDKWLATGEDYADIKQSFSNKINPFNKQELIDHKNGCISEPRAKKIGKLIDNGLLDVRDTVDELQSVFDEIDELIKTVKDITPEDFGQQMAKADRLTRLYKLRADLVKTNKLVIDDPKNKGKSSSEEVKIDIGAALHGSK